MAPDVEKADVEVKPDGSHPETVPWSQYVGIKEKMGKIETDLGAKVQTLEEAAKGATSPEEVAKIRQELADATTAKDKAEGDLKTKAEETTAKMRESLKGKGISEEKLATMSDEALGALSDALGSWKPGPDMAGGGSGSGDLTGRTPLSLAREAYQSSNK